MIGLLERKDAAAESEISSLLYRELRDIARRYLRSQRPDHTLQPTALVHEAFLRIAEADAVDWRDNAHFMALAAKTMRHILVDHARQHNADKRGGDRQQITLSAAVAERGLDQLDLLALDEALTKMAALDPRQARIVELRFFGELTGDQIAALLGISRNTVVRELTVARAWLLKELDGGSST